MGGKEVYIRTKEERGDVRPLRREETRQREGEVIGHSALPL